MPTLRYVIKAGAEYIYTAQYPAECTGHRYRVIRFVVDVPSYQKKALIEALSGPDKGLRFTCTLNNFIYRYREAGTSAEQPTEPVRLGGVNPVMEST